MTTPTLPPCCAPCLATGSAVDASHELSGVALCAFHHHRRGGGGVELVTR